MYKNILFTIAVIFLGVLLWNKDLKYKNALDKHAKDIILYRDSITNSEKIIRELYLKTDSLENQASKIDTIIINTKERFKNEKAFVTNATVNQLDSVIRTNSGIPGR